MAQQIQWYPGHMHKAAREMRERFSNTDVFIEIRDARIPYSSTNPMLAEIRGDKPLLVVLTKSDLANSEVTAKWEHYFSSQKGTTVLLVSKDVGLNPRSFSQTVRTLSVRQKTAEQHVSALVTGVPNVGKSSFINKIYGRSIAKTGNEPAITKMQQRIELVDSVILFDTPGVLWPNVENRNSGYRLAITGAIRDTAISHADVAAYLIEYLQSIYPQSVKQRYGEMEDRSGGLELLTQVGRARGCLQSGGKVDLDRTAKIILSDFREGRIGRISLETPEMMEEEEVEVIRLRQEKADKKQARKKNFKSSRKKSA